MFIDGRSQIGHGIGSFISGLGRMVLPWLKLSFIDREAGTRLQIAQDALSGRNLGESMRDRAKQARQHLLTGAMNHVQQSRSGVRRRRKCAAPPGEPIRKRIKQTVSRHRFHSKKQRKRRQAKKKHSKKLPH